MVENKNLDDIIKKALHEVINESLANRKLRIEDYFDVHKLTRKKVLSIAYDIRAFIQGKGYGYDLTPEGDLVIKEGSNLSMPFEELVKELSELGFRKWQVAYRKGANNITIATLYADIYRNTDIIVNKMSSCGWTKARISDAVMMYGIPVRVMEFDPKEQESAKDEARRYRFLYHWTPYANTQSVLTNGIEPRSENTFLSYPPKAHLMKGDITKQTASNLCFQLFNKNTNLKDGRYSLLRIQMSKVPLNVEFYGDPRFEYGFFTKDVIPSNALTLFGEIYFPDKYNYNREKIKVFVPDDTMIG